MVYWKQGFEVPFGRKQALQMSIGELSNVFPPPKPKTSDVRYQNFAESVQKYGVGNCEVYHFARWEARVERPCLTNYESCVRHSGVVGVYADCRLVCWGTVGVECVDGSTNETVEDLLVLFYLTEEIYRYIYI